MTYTVMWGYWTTFNPVSVELLNTLSNKKLSYCRETARQLHTSFSAHSLIVHFT